MIESTVTESDLNISAPPFAKGGYRACYVHPSNDGLCLKIMMPHWSPAKKRQRGPWYKQMRPLSRYDDNLQEYLALKEIAEYAPAIVGQHVPACYGFVDTDQGRALVTDLYRDFDGNISQNLLNFLKTHGDAHGIGKAISDFQQAVLEHGILSRRLLLHNIVAQRKSETQCQLFLIDGIGNHEFIPLSQIWPLMRRLKIKRKIRRMQEHVGKVLRGEHF